MHCHKNDEYFVEDLSNIWYTRGRTSFAAVFSSLVTPYVTVDASYEDIVDDLYRCRLQ